MMTMAAAILDRIGATPGMSAAARASAVESVPRWQWLGPFWRDLAQHCRHRACVELSPYNSDDAFGIRPEADKTYAPRCLRRAPDGRGLAWMASGGSLADYGECRSRGCPMSMGASNG